MYNFEDKINFEIKSQKNKLKIKKYIIYTFELYSDVNKSIHTPNFGSNNERITSRPDLRYNTQV